MALEPSVHCEMAHEDVLLHLSGNHHAWNLTDKWCLIAALTMQRPKFIKAIF